MAKQLILPFAGLRPNPQYAQQVVAPPYDVVSSEEARVLAEGRPWSFLHISKPEIDLPLDTDPYSDATYKKASENMARMLNKGILDEDKQSAYYLYRIEIGDHIQTGFVGAASIEAYENNLIRRHELTRPDKEDDRVKQILAVNCQTGPVYAIHQIDSNLSKIATQVSNGRPEYSVVSFDGAMHTLWIIQDCKLINEIGSCFENLGVIYIADGHHRSAAASRVATRMASENHNHTGIEPYNNFLIVSFPENEVKILDYNRVVSGLNGLTVKRLLEQIGNVFGVTIVSKAVRPVSANTFGMYLEGQWHTLKYKGADPDAIGTSRLDVSILMDEILFPLLGIKDQRTDNRIGYVGGIRGLEELERLVDCGNWDVAFALYPISTGELMAIADKEQIMPPKTTWFEPKLLDGLVSLNLG